MNDDEWVLMGEVSKVSSDMNKLFQILEDTDTFINNTDFYRYDYDIFTKEDGIHLMIRLFVNKDHLDRVRQIFYEKKQN